MAKEEKSRLVDKTGNVDKRSKDVPDDRLMNLFRNRAELKKTFLEQQAERDHLREQLRNQEASTRRAEERLEAMERLLSKPEAGHSALVYFQLRSVWKACHEQLLTFSEQLFKQQEERARKKQIMRFNQERERRLADLSDTIGEARIEVDKKKAAFDSAKAELDAASGLFGLLRRRRLRSGLASAQADWEDARGKLETLFDKRIKIEAEPWPEFGGLNVESRRAVNIAVIALAQHLYLHFSEGDLSRAVRDAVTRPVQDIKYGSEQDCKCLMATIQERLAAMRDGPDWAQEIRARATQLRRAVTFRSDRETVPMAGSLSSMPVVIGDDNLQRRVAHMPLDVNVLSEEYWDIYQAFVA